jgi:tetratricopeptide (TPR) repeat protein
MPSKAPVKTALASIAVFLASVPFLAQTSQPDSQALNQKAAELYSKGKFDDAIPILKNVVSNEKTAAKNSETHAIALMNLGVAHKERLRASIRRNEAARPEDVRVGYESMNEDAKEADEALRDSLEIYTKLGQGGGLSVALLKNELAWVLNNFFPVAFRGGPRVRIDEAEKLYTESLAAQEKLSAPESDTTLRSVLGLGDFYMRWINFEKALPYYERYLAAIEKKLGSSSKALVPALRSLAELAIITDRTKEAEELTKRISAITGRPEPVPSTNPRLALRGRRIERVKIARFAPPEHLDDPSFLLSYAYGAGQVMMGRVRVKQVAVNILVDEEGNVIEASVVDRSLKEVDEIEKAARASKFRPFSYKGESRKMRGTLIYPYVEN